MSAKSYGAVDSVEPEPKATQTSPPAGDYTGLDAHTDTSGTSGYAHEGVPLRRVRSRWSTGVFDCSGDPMSCLEIAIIPCFSLGYQFNAVEHNRVGELHTGMCVLAFAGDFLFNMGTPIAATYVRMLVRRRFNIVGDDVEDVLYGVFCAPCSICQTYRELSVRGMWPGGVILSQPYVPLQSPQPQYI